MMFHVLNALMLLAFATSAAVQLNDPDPVLWSALYAAGAGMAALAWWRLPWGLPVAVAAAALLWGATLAPALLEAPPADLVGDVKMKSPVVEEAREAVGLGLVGAWMIVLAVRARRASGGEATPAASSQT